LTSALRSLQSPLSIGDLQSQQQSQPPFRTGSGDSVQRTAENSAIPENVSGQNITVDMPVQSGSIRNDAEASGTVLNAAADAGPAWPPRRVARRFA
jgi:hypothetical protein